jgi:hypothetical protein
MQGNVSEIGFFFRPQVRGSETTNLLGRLERANLNKFPEHCVFSCLEFQTMAKVQKPSNNNYYVRVLLFNQFLHVV